MDQIDELDPDGDVVLTLHNGNAPFAVWESDIGLYKRSSPEKARRKKNKKEKRRAHNIIFLQEIGFIAPVTDAQPPSDILPSSSQTPPADLSPAFGDLAVFENEHTELSASPISSIPSRSLDSPPDPSEPNEDRISLRLRLSSKHLILSSLYFKRMLSGSWKESIYSSADSCYYVNASDWDAEALLLFMKIIHGRTRSVPRSVSLEMLAKFSVLADYYECYEAVEVFSDMWIEKLKNDIPENFCRDLVLWLLVSWVYRQAEIFQVVTKRLLQQSNGPIPALNLPIPQTIIKQIDCQRQNAIKRIIQTLDDLIKRFRGETGCSFECSSILLGALDKEMHANGFLPEQLKPPFLGHSFTDAAAKVRGFRTPNWLSHRSTYGYDRHGCCLATSTGPALERLEQGLVGFVLESFPRKMPGNPTPTGSVSRDHRQW